MSSLEYPLDSRNEPSKKPFCFVRDVTVTAKCDSNSEPNVTAPSAPLCPSSRGAGQTSDRRLTGPSIERGVEPHPIEGHIDRDAMVKILFKEKARLDFKVPIYHKELYMSLSKQAKRMVKNILLKTIESLSNAALSDWDREDQQNIVINMNIVQPIQISTDEHDETGLLKEKIKILEEQLRDSKEVLSYYKEKVEKLRPLIAQLEKAIKNRNMLEMATLIRKIKEVM